MVTEVGISLTISQKPSSIHPPMPDKPTNMDDKPKEDEIDFLYEIDPAYRIIGVNSVLTTVAGKDELKIDFVVESLAIPQRIRHRLLPKRMVGEMLDADPKDKYVRHVQVGIVLSFEKAEGIADHIKRQVEKARKTQGG